MSMFLLVLIILLVVGGGWGYSRWGAASWSPIGIILVILLILLATGNLRCNDNKPIHIQNPTIDIR